MNLSYEGDRDTDNKNIIMQSKKWKAMECRDCILLIKELYRCTIAAIDKYVTIYNKDISKRSIKSNAHLKSENCEIILRSLRSFMAAASSSLVTQ